MQLRPSERKRAKIKMALQGASGTGKTYSSLLLAKGLTNGDFSKIAIIDTENGSADLYAHLGNYNVLSLNSPFTPENYIKAIEVCENTGMQVIILDSISHCWDELLDFHSKLTGNSFTNWAKVTPRQKAFVDKILHSNAHIIATMRTKQDYVLNQKDGKFIPEKVGLKSVQRDGLDYEFTLVFDIDIKHFATYTGLFMGKPDFIISEKTGKEILDWCNAGSLLAKQWLETIRQIYEEKDLPKEGFSTEIVKSTGKELARAVDKGYSIIKGIDYEEIDHIARDILKRNVWKFSVAKNHNDLIRLNNLLLNKDGSIRAWNEFKREALAVAGTSNRYLKPNTTPLF